jgi:hypothetical protein
VTDRQVMALLRYHINYKIVEFHFGGDRLLKVDFYDHGGNRHKEAISAEGKLITYEV